MMETAIDKVSIKKYPAYKDSGVEWLEEIPTHWHSNPLYTVGKVVSKINNQERELLSVYLERGVIKFSDVTEKRTNVTSEDLSKYQSVEPGYLVLNNQQAWRGSVGVSKYRGIVSPAYIVLALSNTINSDFANYLFRDGTMVSHYLICSKGVGTIQRNLYWPQLKRANVCLPPLPEQTAIAAFLDRKTTLIDQAINIKQKQIDLLKERRQILIHKAVTRGLNPNAKMKDSGVEWIGEIPEHWEVSRLKNHIELLTGFPFKSENYTSEGIKLARGINVKESVFNWEETRYWPVVEKHLERYLLKEGDVLISMDGSKVGKNFCKVKEEDLPILLLQRVARLRSTSLLNSSFLFNHIVNRNFLLWVEMTKTDPMVPHIAPSDINNFQITIPPLAEQKVISEIIDIISSKIATAISFKEQEIEKLKEYKATLINSAVTGKIMVNGQWLMVNG
jgi:type I restriction enzyme S subunit